MYTCIDGEIKKRALVEATDDIIFGIGFFETLRVYNFVPFLLNEHLARLANSAKILKLQVDVKKLSQAVEDVIVANQLQSGIIRIVVSRKHQMIFALELYDIPTRAKLIKAPWRRTTGGLAGAKTLNYFELVLAREFAKKKGAFEAVFADDNGWVTEGTASNIFLVKKGKIYTPPLSLGILNGITRQLVIKLAEKQGLNVKEKLFTLQDCLKADEVFITNSLVEVLQIEKIEGRSIRLGQVSLLLLARYKEAVRKHNSNFFSI